MADPRQQIATVDAGAEQRVLGDVATAIEEIEIVDAACGLEQRRRVTLIGDVGLAQSENDGSRRVGCKQSVADPPPTRGLTEAQMKWIEVIEIFTA